jgi:TRAP-type C4-dicarboxylate transport system permease small subunit
MKRYTLLCSWLARLLMAFLVVGLAVIVVALTLQVVFRYALNAPLQLTDEIALNTLTWMCFLGAAMLYRERGHIVIDYFANKLSRPVAAVIAILIEVLVIGVMLMICIQVVQTQGIMSKVMYGTMYISKFHLQFVPLFASCIATLLFAIEYIARQVRVLRAGDRVRG